MEYEIAEGGNTKELKEAVRKFVAMGFKPSGGIAIAQWFVGDKKFWLLTQAMVKEEVNISVTGVWPAREECKVGIPCPSGNIMSF